MVTNSVSRGLCRHRLEACRPSYPDVVLGSRSPVPPSSSRPALGGRVSGCSGERPRTMASQRTLPGPVTANVCKMAIGHEGQIYQQLVRCCGCTVLRPSIVPFDTLPSD